jgi:hypothetical protein
MIRREKNNKPTTKTKRTHPNPQPLHEEKE